MSKTAQRTKTRHTKTPVKVSPETTPQHQTSQLRSAPERRGSRVRKVVVWGTIGASALIGGGALLKDAVSSSPSSVSATANGPEGRNSDSSRGDGAVQQPETQQPDFETAEPIYQQGGTAQQVLEELFKNDEGGLNTNDKRYLSLEFDSTDNDLYSQTVSLMAEHARDRQTRPGAHIRYTVQAMSQQDIEVPGPTSTIKVLPAHVIERKYSSANETTPYQTTGWTQDVTIGRSVRNPQNPTLAPDANNLSYVWTIVELSNPIADPTVH